MQVWRVAMTGPLTNPRAIFLAKPPRPPYLRAMSDRLGSIATLSPRTLPFATRASIGRPRDGGQGGPRPGGRTAHRIGAAPQGIA